MNSRTKGKVGERELAKLLQGHGYDAHRGQQYCGIMGDADVVGVDGLHIECKRTEAFRDEVALQQAERDARKGEVPSVWYRRSREGWKTVMRSEVFLLIWDELTDLQKHKIKEKMKFMSRVDKMRK